MDKCSLEISDDLRPICYKTLGVVLLVFMVTQFFFLWRPMVNLEFAFVEAARSLAGVQSADRMAYYWHYQANPLGYSLVASLVLRVLPMLDSLVAVRLISILGGVLLLVSVADLQRYLSTASKKKDFWCLLLCAFHPMIWLYSNSTTADVFPAGLILASIACCCRGRTKMLFHFLGIFLFCMACIVKFNCTLMALGFVYILGSYAYWNRQDWFKHIGWLMGYALCSVLTLGLYFLWVYHEYGIVFFSDEFKGALTFKRTLSHFLMVLLLYLNFLLIFSGPLVWVLLKNHFTKINHKTFLLRWLLLIFVTSIFSVTLNGIMTVGEMNFGGLVGLLPLHILSLIQIVGIILVYLLISVCIQSYRNRSQRGYIELMLATIIPYLLISAMTRPAQRYLILVFPLVLIWFVYLAWESRLAIARVLVVSSFIVFLGLSILGVLYINAQGYAAKKMGAWVVDHKLSSRTDPGILVAHIGNFFSVHSIDMPDYRLEIKPPESHGQLQSNEVHVEQVKIGSWIVKRFVLSSVENE